MPVKPRCTFKECKTAAQRIVGDCGFCDGHFCAKHRLLEDHKCTGLEDVSLAQSAADPPYHHLLESSSTGGKSVGDTTQWWLVGLADARKSLTSATLRNLRLRGHKSSEAYKPSYPPLTYAESLAPLPLLRNPDF
ncbi:hypothetical protein F5Y10DRAFT_260370 [Nemania abortiva]|nr:hypothetical protein F5Y10DRAFT_260370 [Nemania abortiva]